MSIPYISLLVSLSTSTCSNVILLCFLLINPLSVLAWLTVFVLDCGAFASTASVGSALLAL